MKNILTNPNFKGALGRPLMKVLYLNQNSPRQARFKICKEIFMTISVVIFTKKDFYLLDELNNRIGAFKSAGLIEHWHLEDVDVGMLNEKERAYPKVLGLKHSMGCFQILFCGWGIGACILLWEILSSKFSNTI